MDIRKYPITEKLSNGLIKDYDLYLNIEEIEFFVINYFDNKICSIKFYRKGCPISHMFYSKKILLYSCDREMKVSQKTINDIICDFDKYRVSGSLPSPISF